MAELDAVPGQHNPDDEADRELIAAWRGGNTRAGDQLTVKYFPQIRKYFVRRAPEEYEDLNATTFMRLSKSYANYRGEATVRTFIYSIARNVLREHLRALSRRPEFDPITTSLFEAYGRRPSSILAEHEEHQILLDALQELTSEDQDLLELRYWTELTGPELRELFGIPEGTVRSRIGSSLGRLRKKFHEISEQPREFSDELLERWMQEAGHHSSG